MKLDPHLRSLGVAVGWMVLPSIFLLAVMRLIAHVSDKGARVVFLLLTIFCVAGQVMALYGLKDKGWPFLWKIPSFLLKVIGVALLLIFTEMAFLIGYYTVYPHAPPLFGGH